MDIRLFDYIYTLCKNGYLKSGDKVQVYSSDQKDSFSVDFEINYGKTLSKKSLASSLYMFKDKYYDILEQILLNGYCQYRSESGRIFRRERIKTQIVLNPKTGRKNIEIQPSKKSILYMTNLGYKHSFSFEIFALPKEYTDSKLFKCKILGPYIYNCIIRFGNSVLSPSNYLTYIDKYGTHDDLEKEISDVVGFNVRVHQLSDNNHTFYIIEKTEKSSVKS